MQQVRADMNACICKISLSSTESFFTSQASAFSLVVHEVSVYTKVHEGSKSLCGGEWQTLKNDAKITHPPTHVQCCVAMVVVSVYLYQRMLAYRIKSNGDTLCGNVWTVENAAYSDT